MDVTLYIHSKYTKKSIEFINENIFSEHTKMYALLAKPLAISK